MQRRTWLRTAAGAIAGYAAVDSARADLGQGLRVFQLLVNDPGGHPATQLLDAFVSGGQIYYLACESGDPSDNLVSKVGCSSFAGKIVWRRRLPYGINRNIGVAENGNLLLLRLSPFRTAPANSVYTVAPGDGNPPQLTLLAPVPSTAADEVGKIGFLTGAHFGSMANGASFSITTAQDASQSRAPSILVVPGPPLLVYDVLEYNQNSVLVVNRATAEIGVCNAATAVYSQAAISGAAIAAAKSGLQHASARWHIRIRMC